MSTIFELLPCCPKLSACFLWQASSSRELTQIGLALFPFLVLVFTVLTTNSYLLGSSLSNPAALLLSSSISFNFPLPLFDGGLVIVVRVSGGVLGHLSSSSLLNVTPHFMHK